MKPRWRSRQPRQFSLAATQLSTNTSRPQQRNSTVSLSSTALHGRRIRLTTEHEIMERRQLLSLAGASFLLCQWRLLDFAFSHDVTYSMSPAPNLRLLELPLSLPPNLYSSSFSKLDVPSVNSTSYSRVKIGGRRILCG